MKFVWERTDNWVEAMENAYIKFPPAQAYFKNRDMIASAYAHGVIDMVMVVEFLRINSDILESRGYSSWEVLGLG